MYAIEMQDGDVYATFQTYAAALDFFIRHNLAAHGMVICDRPDLG